MEISDPSCWFPHYPGKCSEKMCLGMTPGAGGPGLGSPPGLQQGLAAPGLCRRKEPPLGHLSIALSLSPLRTSSTDFFFLSNSTTSTVNLLIFSVGQAACRMFSQLCATPQELSYNPTAKYCSRVSRRASGGILPSRRSAARRSQTHQTPARRSCHLRCGPVGAPSHCSGCHCPRLCPKHPAEGVPVLPAGRAPGRALPAETDRVCLTIYQRYIRAHSRAVIHLLRLQVSVEELF